MDLSILKNPIILGIIMTILTYFYLYWENKKKYEKNSKVPKEQVNIIIPIAVGVLTWFVIYSFFSNKTSGDIQPIQTIEAQTGGVIKLIENNPTNIKTKISERLTDTFDSQTYHLIGKNAIKLPQTDVFIDIAKF